MEKKPVHGTQGLATESFRKFSRGSARINADLQEWQTAWGARHDLDVLDPPGVIRFKNVFRPELPERAGITLLKDRTQDPGPSRKMTESP
jgi:hypothetical protein